MEIKKRNIKSVYKNKTNCVNKYKKTNKKTLKCHIGGGDIYIYYKKPGLFSFNKIEASTDKNPKFYKIKTSELYKLPQIKINNVGTYKFNFYIKNYVEGNDITYNLRGRGYSASLSFENFAEYTHTHNRFMSNIKELRNLNTKILDKYVKKFRQISINIKIYKLEKNDTGKIFKEYKNYYFNLEPID
jgi:hypothetical protein